MRKREERGKTKTYKPCENNAEMSPKQSPKAIGIARHDD